MSNNELKRAVERAMEKRDRPSSHTLGVTTLAIADFDTIMNALSERAELLATVERMRAGLEKITTNYGPGHLAHQIARAALTTGEATTPNAGEGK